MKPPANLKPGRETAAYVLDLIQAFPGEHDQGSWERRDTVCGTTRCVGGWTLWAHGLPISTNEYIQEYSHSRAARELLGISADDADLLFYWVQEPEDVVRALEFLARDENIDWDIVFKDNPNWLPYG